MMGARMVWRCSMASVVMVTAAVALYLITRAMWGKWTIHAFMAGSSTLLLVLLAIIFAHLSWMNPADSHTIKTLLLQYIIIHVLKLLGKKNMDVILQHSNDPTKIQEITLMEILKRNATTKYGKEHRFNYINNSSDFRTSHPLTTYSDFQDYIERIKLGEKCVLTNDEVLYLGQTSGTTGQNKSFPITKALKHNIGKKMGSMMYYTMIKNGALGLGRMFTIAYRARAKESPGGLMMGPVTRHMARYIPVILSPKCVCDITDEKLALYAHAVFGLREPEVDHFRGLMSSLVYSFFRTIETNWRSICDDIEHGRISISGVPDDVITEINGCLTPAPVRAQELRKQFAIGFKGIAKRIWPRLTGADMLASGGFAVHAQILKNTYMSGIEQLSFLHVATEGFMGFNTDLRRDQHLYTLIPHYAYLEFIPVNKIHDKNPETLIIEQLQKNEEYEIVMTTPMGLYRYRTGDVIKVVDFRNKCPIYEFQYRLGQLLNLYWEKTPENVFANAVVSAVRKIGTGHVTLLDYTATEDVVLGQCSETNGEEKHYVLFIELEQDGEDYVLEENQKRLFDDCLCEVFELYKSLRQNRSIGRMRVIQVRQGAFMQLKYRMIKDSMNQQFKTPRVLRNIDTLRFLLDLKL